MLCVGTFCKCTVFAAGPLAGGDEPGHVSTRHARGEELPAQAQEPGAEGEAQRGLARLLPLHHGAGRQGVRHTPSQVQRTGY